MIKCDVVHYCGRRYIRLTLIGFRLGSFKVGCLKEGKNNDALLSV